MTTGAWRLLLRSRRRPLSTRSSCCDIARLYPARAREQERATDAPQQVTARPAGDPPSVSKSGACAMVSSAYLGATMKPAPIIVRTATAVPGHSATQDQVKERLRGLLALPARKMDAVMELFDHTAVERRFTVEPLSELGKPRGLGE